MLKRVSALLLAVFFFMPQEAFGVSQSELNRMSVFLNNFFEAAEYEASLYNFDVDTVTMNELLAFGIWHNYLNNQSLVKSVEDDNDYNCSIASCRSSGVLTKRKNYNNAWKTFFLTTLKTLRRTKLSGSSLQRPSLTNGKGKIRGQSCH